MVRCTISYDANEALSSYDELPDDLEDFSKMFNERTFNRDLEIIVRGFRQCMDFRFLKMPAFRTDLYVKINVAQGSVLSQSRTSAVRSSFSSNRFRHSGFRRGGCGEVGIDALLGIRPVAFFAAVVRAPGVANGIPTIVTLGHASCSGN